MSFKGIQTLMSFAVPWNLFSSKMDASKALMEEMKQEIKKVRGENKEMKHENTALKCSIVDLQLRVRNLEQYSRRNNIEISGVPGSQSENIELVLVDIARSINVVMSKEAVVVAHRVPSFSERRTPSIIVKFTTKREKDTWIEGFKTRRPLTADMINRKFGKEEVYVNEHLSPANKLLLKKTKEVAQTKNYAYVWNKDGKIFVRKEAGDKIRRINNEDELKYL